jgi:hypothetical protein
LLKLCAGPRRLAIGECGISTKIIAENFTRSQWGVRKEGTINSAD